MADSAAAAARVLKNEDATGKGILTRDGGGLTRFGISSRAYPKEDIANMTAERAKALFVRDYWKPLKLDGVTSQGVAESIFDFAVNAGLSRSRSTVRQVTGAKRTGAMTALDVIEINSIDPKKFMVAFGLARSAFYKRLAANDPTLAKYLKGWLKRAEGFYQNISKRQLVFVGFPVVAAVVLMTYKAGKIWQLKTKKKTNWKPRSIFD
jgi:lysozyme family protein